jgi:cupin 2 domain-containing protein
MITSGNIFAIENETDSAKEVFIKLFGNNNCIVEKIISTGQSTPENEWLEEDSDEWVILLQGESEINFYNGENNKMGKGDYLLIPSNTKHRVVRTSKNPPCIWLAIHMKSNK